MSQNSENISGNQEIDLSLVSRKIGGFFENISTRIFRGILFLQRNILVIGILFVIGVAIGFYMDKSKRIYENKVIVTPNFGSVDYLYTKIDLIQSKINEGDTLFLKNNIGLKQPKKLLGIEIKPIIDIYKFINEKEEREEKVDNSYLTFDMIKLLAEEGDVNKILKDETTSKNYSNHTIVFITSSKTNIDEVIQPLLKYLNQSEYYSALQKEDLINLHLKIEQEKTIISQIDNFLNNFSTNVNDVTKSSKMVYYNENSPLNEIIRTKHQFVREIGKNQMNLIKKSKIIKESDITLNIIKKQVIGGKFKIIMPFLFVLAFIFAGAFRSYYRRQMAKLNA